MKIIRKVNPNGHYSLYSSNNGNTWRESATVKNTDLYSSEYVYDGENYSCKYAPENVEQFPELLPNEVLNIKPSWVSSNWSITVDGTTRTLKPTVTLTPLELYNITVWKEEMLGNTQHPDLPAKAKQRAIDLGIWGYFSE